MTDNLDGFGTGVAAEEDAGGAAGAASSPETGDMVDAAALATELAGGVDKGALGVEPDVGLPEAEGDGPDAEPLAEQDAPAALSPERALAALEAVLMVVDQPAATTDLAIAVGLPRDQVEALLHGLAAEYRGADGGRPRGFELREIAGGWRFYSSPDHAEVVERFVRDGAASRLTAAALETLAIVAYKGPITRGRVSAVRGVNVDSVMRTLASRGLVEEAGLEESSGAVLYTTTDLFLERMGINSLDELAPLAPNLPTGEEFAELRTQVEST